MPLPTTKNNCRAIEQDYGPTVNGITLQRYDYIPVDFIKCEIININPTVFFNNPILNFTRSVNTNTGETKKTEPYYLAEYKNIKIKIYDNHKMYFAGSLHKLYNDGLHNYNDFTLDRYNHVIGILKNDFGVYPTNLRIQVLEYGVNILPPVKTNEILRYCHLHKKVFLIDKLQTVDGRYKEAKHDKYILKLYNKAQQYRNKKYKIPNEIFRLEVKQTNWSEYRKIRINTLEDFNGSDKKPFLENLLRCWDEVVFFDPTHHKDQLEHKYSNPNFWETLKSKNKNTWYNHINKLKEWNKKGSKDIQGQISNIILAHVNDLNIIKAVRTCLLTGVNISMQKEGSILLSHSGLNCLLINNQKEFEKLESIFLSSIHIGTNLKTRIKMIAHNIRCCRSNRQRSLNPMQLCVFDR